MLREDKILNRLSLAGYRVTQPRRAVVRALLEDQGYSSPAEVHERARSHCESVGLVTVYRTLDLLTRMGFARRIHAEDGCHGYATANHGHRHHLICRKCGDVTEFEGCELSPFLDRLSHETGFTIEEHLLELVGLCSVCQHHALAGPPPLRAPQQRVS